MTNEQGIVVIEDDPQLRRFLKTGLEAHGYLASTAGSARDALALIVTEQPAVILLDLGLPDMDGHTLISEIRSWSSIPVIVLSARNASAEKIAALDHGANDFVTKPFDMGELLARIRAALRHRIVAAGGQPLFRSGEIEIDFVRRLVRRAGEEVHLSPREYNLLRVLASNAGMVMTHHMLLLEIWGNTDPDNINYLRIFIGRLRHKLEADPARPRLITTEPGIGYRLRESRE